MLKCGRGGSLRVSPLSNEGKRNSCVQSRGLQRSGYPGGGVMEGRIPYREHVEKVFGRDEKVSGASVDKDRWQKRTSESGKRGVPTPESCIS